MSWKEREISKVTLKRKKCSCKFQASWKDEFLFLTESFKGNGHAFCKICRADFSVEHGARTDVNHHRESDKHKSVSVKVYLLFCFVIFHSLKVTRMQETKSRKLIFSGGGPCFGFEMLPIFEVSRLARMLRVLTCLHDKLAFLASERATKLNRSVCRWSAVLTTVGN